uniref:NADH-ubiquinone oxidoreductase chain 2 n=1 Tax=Palaestes abruptus TaxID=2528286 RepID=A0A7G7MTW6_9CUCU|nr:NADH dehydrogenase subunit 2 [Palaestes abruptus]QNG56275.1 NADH dehydrogenase subunit 2 [Palaestes abruptus]QNG56405.1 NADH dehydrogenase subunit 2 [Palaestes abruptus]
MIKFYKIIFMNGIMIGTLISISSYSWFSMWMGLEINLLSLIPLLNNQKSIFPSEAAMKYFITQTLASVILLFAIIMIMNKMENFVNLNFMLMILNSSLLTKMGAAPFHFWFPEVMEGISWMNCLIILTWQKIAPMIILMYNINLIKFFTSIILISAIIGSIMGLNQISLRKIFAYSSISHISWMIASMMYNQSIWFIYFITYSFINMNLVIIFFTINIFYLKQLFNSLNKNKLVKIFFLLNFFSISGMPPFLGFMPKWLTINNLIYNNLFFLSLFLIMFTLISMYFYLRIMFSTLILNNNENLKSFSKNNFMIYFINFINLMSLLTCTLIFNFL